MPPHLALAICAVFVGYALWADRTAAGRASVALWIPLIWVLLAESRFASQWLSLGTPRQVESLEGSPLDALVFGILIACAVVVLANRRVRVGDLLSRNPWVWLYFVFGALSLLWSDYPDVATKRLIKASGNLLMVAVVLTDTRPYHALGVVLRRSAIILIPLSIVLIKYFPELARGYHMGMPMFTGVATHKNGLGQLCLVTVLYFWWSLLFRLSSKEVHLATHLAILAMTAWLLYIADSATATLCAATGVGMIALGRLQFVRRRPARLLWIVIGGSAMLAALELALDASGALINLLGRRPDLTTRVPMWTDLLRMSGDPLVGYGFESFWLGARQELMAERWSITSQAHNGYLEMYLNLGLAGLCFILAWVVSGFINIGQSLRTGYSVAVLRLAFVAVVVLYNWTEATFYGVSIMWMLLLVGIMQVKAPRAAALRARQTAYPAHAKLE